MTIINLLSNSFLKSVSFYPKNFNANHQFKFYQLTSSISTKGLYSNVNIARNYSNNENQKSFKVTPKEEKSPKKDSTILRLSSNTSVWDAPLHAVDPSSYVRPSKRRNGAIFGMALFLFVIGLYVFSLYSLGQENFEDVRLPEETLRKLEQRK